MPKCTGINFLKATGCAIVAVVFLGCSDTINHCVYGMPDDVVSISAKVCRDSYYSYQKIDGFWQFEKPVNSYCDGFDTILTFQDGEIRSTSLYTTSFGEKKTFFYKYNVDEERNISLSFHDTVYSLQECRPEEQVKFTYKCHTEFCERIQSD